MTRDVRDDAVEDEHGLDQARDFQEPGVAGYHGGSGSMHDNPTLSKESVQFLLDSYSSDLWRKAREYGDFVDVGG
jgi:hypothetical protein